MVVDRIEGTTAVVETGSGFVDVPVSQIRGRVRDGAVLVENADGTYTVDEGQSARAAETVQERASRLFTKQKPKR